MPTLSESKGFRCIFITVAVLLLLLSMANCNAIEMETCSGSMKLVIGLM